MNQEDSRSLARDIVEWGASKRAEELVVLDVRGLSDVTDYFVLLTGTTQIQVQAIADAILDGAVQTKRKPLHLEGRDMGRWVLIDFVDVVAHVMQPETRQFYSLERLWGDAPVERYDENGEAVDDQADGSPGQENQA